MPYLNNLPSSLASTYPPPPLLPHQKLRLPSRQLQSPTLGPLTISILNLLAAESMLLFVTL